MSTLAKGPPVSFSNKDEADVAAQEPECAHRAHGRTVHLVGCPAVDDSAFSSHSHPSLSLSLPLPVQGFVALKEIRLLLWGFLVFLFGMITFL
ncbi:hypothetical protein AAC387_Pa04g1669 [Persea americana]